MTVFRPPRCPEAVPLRRRTVVAVRAAGHRTVAWFRRRWGGPADRAADVPLPFLLEWLSVGAAAEWAAQAEITADDARWTGAPAPSAPTAAPHDRQPSARVAVPAAAWRVGKAALEPHRDGIRWWLRRQIAARHRSARRAAVWRLAPFSTGHETPPDGRPVWLRSVGAPPTMSDHVRESADTRAERLEPATVAGAWRWGAKTLGPLAVLWSLAHALDEEALLWFLEEFSADLLRFGGDSVDRDALARWRRGTLRPHGAGTAEAAEALAVVPDGFGGFGVRDTATGMSLWRHGRVELSALSHMFLLCASAMVTGARTDPADTVHRAALVRLMAERFPRQLHDVVVHDIECHEVGLHWLRSLCSSEWPAATHAKIARTRTLLAATLMEPAVMAHVAPAVAVSCARLGLGTCPDVMGLLERARLWRAVTEQNGTEQNGAGGGATGRLDGIGGALERSRRRRM